MDLKALYREVIIDHYRKPRNARPLAQPDREAKCKNPSCGDRVTLQLELRDDAVVDVGLIGTGCAISQASASMMTEAIKGKSLDETERVLRAFRAMIVEGDPAPSEEVLGDLVVLQGVAKLHARVKCAMCGWSALEAALEQREDEIDLERDKSMPAARRGGGI
jgi:nitrogen fixation NifU-like protein